MDISFAARKLSKIFSSEAALKKAFGEPMARKIAMRMAVLSNAATLSLVPTTPPDRCHQLAADRDEQFAVDLLHPKRLVFEPDHDPMPRREDGGIDTAKVTKIKIIDVVDYH